LKFKTLPLSELAEIGDGNHSSNYPKASEMIKKGVPFLRSGNIQNGKIVDKKLKFISLEKHEILKKGHVKTGDILFTNRGEIGKVGIIDERFNNSNLNSQVAWIRVNSQIYNRYLYYYLSSPTVKFFLSKNTTGSALQQITIKQLKSLSISFPIFFEQKRIVDKLEAAFAEIDNSVLIKKSKITNLKTIEKKITNKLILKHGSDFIKRPLHTLFNLSSGKFLPRKKMNLNGKIKVYGGNGISGYHDSFNLENVNILIGRVGAYCGNVYYTNEKIWITDNCLHINSYKYDFDKQFLSMLLSSLNLRAYAHQTAQPAISYSSLKDMELTFPKSIQEQTIIFKSYTDLKNNLKNLNNIYENQMISLKKLKLSVLNKEILNEVA
jgi:type I restriction enzyme, S subunit